MVQTEIERRWLLRKIPDNCKQLSRLEITQFYLEEENNIIRYRRTIGPEKEKIEYFKIIKKRVSGFTNTEEILPINYEEFNQKRFFEGVTEISKTRYIFYDEKQNLTFEIDSFSQFTLSILELELTSEAQSFIIPEFISDHILIEITGLKQFSNYSLSLNKI